MNATRRQVPLVLCCADDGEVALVGVLDELHRKGHAPEVLMGVEAEPATLTAAVDRIRGPALFVLCESEDLDRTQVRRLSGLFSARRGPEHQLLIVQLGPGGGLTMLPKIEAALDAVAGAGPVAGDDDGYHMRDVIEPTGVSALRREAAEQHRRPDRAQAERIARELHDEMVAAEAVLVRRKAEREAYAPPSTPARRPAARRPASARAAGAAVATAGAAAPALDHRAEALVDAETEPLDPTQSDSPAPSAEEEAAEAPGVGPVVERRRTPSGSRKSGPRKSGPRKSAPRDARREEDDSPMANGGMSAAAAAAVAAARDRAIADEVLERTGEIDVLPPIAPVSAPASSGSRPMGKVLLLVSGAGMALLVGLAITSLNSKSPTRPVGRGTPALGTATLAGGVADPASGDAAGDAVGPGPMDAQTGGASAAADPSATDGDEGGAAALPSAGTGGAGAHPAGESEDSGGAADGKGADAGHAIPPSPPSTDLPGPVAQAVADGRVKVHGKILFLASPRETMTWDEANRRCRQRRIAGLGGWRLPSKGQLGRLRRGGFATSGSFWTRQVVGGDEVFAFDAKSAKSSLWLKVEPNGRSLCVRRVP